MHNMTDMEKDRHARRMVHAQKVRALANAALDFADTLERSRGMQFYRGLEWAELELLTAVTDVTGGDDIDALISDLREELGIDEEGYPLDASDDDTFWRESTYAIERGMGQ